MSKVLAVGDIHTKKWIIDEVEKIADQFDRIILIGDYADNWNTSPVDTMATWRYLKAFMNSNEKVTALIGNHDYAYLHPQIAGQSSGWNPVTYQLINAPDNRKLKKFLLDLPYFVEIDDVMYSHAGITEEWDGGIDVWSMWTDTSPIWARPFECTYKKIKQVVGHTPQKSCFEMFTDIWFIDTFSEMRDNTPIGDYTVLVIEDGKYEKLTLQNNNNPTDLTHDVS